LDQELAADVGRLGRGAGLRRFRRRAMLRVAARDLGAAPLEDVVAEISDVADACLAEAARATALTVIGLGKLGGAELNYSSDVDVLFLHDGTGDQRTAEREAAALVRLLSEPTSEGIALRVDADLRPGGRSGVLVRSIDATVEHYERQAAAWERQAQIKARPVAGDLRLGAEYVERMAPIVYPDELAPSAIEEVRRTKVRLEEYVRARGKEATEVKRGRGGIRDVEFAVQLLQLVHGRRDARLREPNTLRALQALAEDGYVAEPDARDLAEAYRFLRRLEHRLQIVRDLQTHELPEDPDQLNRLARAMGMASPTQLGRVYERETEQVRGLHERLFYRPLLEAFAGPSERELRPGLGREATEELLAGLGFTNAPAAYDVFERLVDPATRIGKVLANTFPVMAPALALAANPDQALTRLERIAEVLRERPVAADALAADPAAARRLAHVAAASTFATDLVVATPALVFALGSGANADPRAGLVAAVAAYASRETDVRATGRALADVAETVVSRAVAAARPKVPLAVVGLGKLGARELNFASDLDLVFAYDGEGSADFAEAIRASERVLAGVREQGFEPDADLRPEGRSGPLARSMAAFLEYWERWAEPWEFQSLTRARFLAGDESLGRRFVSAASDFAYPEELPPGWVAAMHKMRRRIERERVKPPEAARFAFKLGYGSLADVQFAVELTMMRHGGRHPEIRRLGTLEAVEALAEARLLEDSVARSLGEAFVFLTDVKDALEVDRRLHAELLPASPDEQRALARRLGYEEYARQAFLDDYRLITQRARSAMERVFADAVV
ncbi:MAG TPA: putative nucleotidyltransferase substrate binding domain-containing protein, partial [Actinomycetota bacterium]|nr:putative nucleotidyltransferase substrate binding domain-containing protein [Actinomycetota bacterium]